MGFFFKKFSNDTQENSKDAQGREEALKGVQEEEINKLKEENTKLKEENTALTDKNKALTTEKDNLTNQLNASQKQVNALEQSQQVLENEKAELTNKITGLSKDKENLTKANTDLTEKNKTLTAEKENLNNQLNASQKQAEQTSQKLKELEQRHAPYQKLEKLYEVFLEVKDRLNFNFVATTHSAMDLIASVLSDSKYYLESLYDKASQELSDKKSDKGEKLAELFDLLFEYIKDSKFERLKEPSAYDPTCKKLYPEQNTSGKMQRVVLIGYTYDKKTTYYTIVDMGS
ncbi:hypothetical protein ACQJ5J_05890 [Helicobacter pylori]